MLWVRDMVAGLQGCRRAEPEVVAVQRTEAQRTAVWEDCAERPRGQLCGQRGPEAETSLLHADLL